MASRNAYANSCHPPRTPAVVASLLPCVLRLTRESDNDTIEIPWNPAYSPRHIRLRLIRGEQYQAILSRVPPGSGFTTRLWTHTALHLQQAANGLNYRSYIISPG